MFKNVGTNDRLVDRIANEIQSVIATRQLSPGTKLPPERELCEQMGVSRTALREAVRMLVSRGLLEIRPGSGTTVRKITSDQISEPLAMLIRTHDETITPDHMHDVRSILEVAIVKMAAENATETDIAELKAIIEQMEKPRIRPADFAEKDAELHRRIAGASHNALLVVLLDSIRDVMQGIRSRVHRYSSLAQIVNPDHRRIVERIAARDPEGAAAAMHDHLEHARAVQEEVLKENKGDRVRS
jgi:DNA-binding FadR family transcriptional regulator